MLKIRRAVYEDIPNIMKFMDKHWKPGNILAKNRDFFEWQFLEDGKVNMFIGIDDETDKIYGMLGVILYSKSENPDISGCTWRTIKSENPMLGMELQDIMWREIHPRYAYSMGLTEVTVKINRLQGLKPVRSQHYYRLADKTEYKIAKINDKIIPRMEDSGYCLKPIYHVEEMKQIISEKQLAASVMSKDYYYIEKRYFNHPVYKYGFWKIMDKSGTAKSILITREENARERKMCKIIDFYGNYEDLGQIGRALDEIMDEKQYEYIDVYSYGVPVEVYEKSGFVSCDEKNTNIIPNYFHPFEQKNVDLWMSDPLGIDVRMFRGDGDQDRPC